MSLIRISIPENFAIKESDEMRQKIDEFISKGEKDFVFNFSECSFIDSTGLGVLVSAYKKCNQINGNVKIEDINDQNVLKVFKLTRLDTIFGL